MNDRPRVVLIRHGETAWSLSGQHTGRTDIPLTAKGEADAEELRGRLAAWRFDQVWCSPLGRARRTAELAGIAACETDADLLEWDYGDFEGRTTDEIRGEYPGWTIWDGPWPGGESIDQVAVRADRVVGRILALPGSPVVGLVGHGHILRVFGARWVGLDPVWGRALVLETGTVSELGWEHETRALRRWNT